MENINKKSIRSNKAQINYLCQYMLEHPGFAAGDYRSPMGAIQNNSEWQKLKEALDKLGPQRSVDQWKICWRDQKRKARSEAGALRQAMNSTGNIIEVPILTDTSALVLGAIGQEMAVGCGPEESPIGFSQDTILHLALSTSPNSHGLAQPQANPHPPPQKRARRTLPPHAFLNAQIELNNLVKSQKRSVKDVQSRCREEIRDPSADYFK